MILSSIDLNLLLVLHTVLEEGSVARAAKRLHVTSSAVSNGLARLRVALGDPLVTRKSRGIVPTARAADLEPVLARALQELEQVIQRRPFDAKSCTRTFTLAMADAGQVAQLPRIAQAFAVEMPNARLRVVNIESLVALGDLASPEIDLHFGRRAKGAGIHAEVLFEEETALVARTGHPGLRRRLSRQRLAELRHVGLDMLPGRGVTDPVTTAYGRENIERSVVVTVPTFAAAAAVAGSTDLVATLPASLLPVYGARLGLRPLSGKIPAHTVPLALCWHERTHTDPAMVALRALVRRAIVAER